MNENAPDDGNRGLKNPGKALLLALVLGGPGLFYVSVPAGCAVFVVDVLIYFLGASTSGFGLILLIPWRIIALLYAMTAVVRHNRGVLDGRR